MSHRSRSDDPLQPVHDVVGDSTLGIALLGGVVAFVTGFIPGSPIIGGAISGWLVRDDRTRGAVVGALAGLVSALPLAFGVFLMFGILAGAGAGGAPFALAGFFVLAFGFLLLAYTVGLGAIGGYLGVVGYERRVAGSRRGGEPADQRHRSDRTSIDDDTQF